METGKNRHIDLQDFSKAHFDELTPNEKISTFVEGYRIPQRKSKAEALDLIRSKIELKNKQAPVRNLQIYWPAAASFVLIALLTTFFFYPKPNRIIADKGQHIEYTLPDGSNVNVNAGSKISYSKSGFTEKRILKLDGEAFFSVQKGIPFVVKTKLGTVEVLGTSLNVYSRRNQFSVSCLTGKVKVSANGESLVILPGEKVDLVSARLIKTSNLPTDEMAGWRTGEFHFDSIPLISIFEEIERQFNVSIKSRGVENRFITANFSNRNLIEVLETVCLPMKLEYEIKNGNKISIKPKK